MEQLWTKAIDARRQGEREAQARFARVRAGGRDRWTHDEVKWYARERAFIEAIALQTGLTAAEVTTIVVERAAHSLRSTA